MINFWLIDVNNDKQQATLVDNAKKQKSLLQISKILKESYDKSNIESHFEIFPFNLEMTNLGYNEKQQKYIFDFINNDDKNFNNSKILFKLINDIKLGNKKEINKLGIN